MMKRRRFLLLAGAMTLAALMVSSVALAQDTGPLSPGAALSTGFTYQGRLVRNGDPVSDTCDFRFTLYDAADGDPVGSPQDKPDEPVSDGYFTVEDLDFGSSVFAGDRRWLGVEVDCEGDGSYTDLGRQEVTAAPYALHAASTGALQGHPVSSSDPTSDQVLKWDGFQWVPAADEMGGGGTGDISAVYAGEGLNRVSDSDSVTLSVDFAGNGAATTATRSDHVHDGRYYTQGQLNTSGGGGQVHWDNVINVPTDVGITYTGGTGLALSDHTFSISPTYRLPQGCAGGEIAEWNSTAGIWECGSDDAGGGTAAWLLTGNAGTTPGTHFLGTTDEVSLTLAVNGTTGLRLEPTSGTPNVIGGYEGNDAYQALYGVTIGGGGASGQANYVDDGNYSTIGGGLDHGILGNYATIGGGRSNYAMGQYTTIGGGRSNMTRNHYATVGGGYDNTGDADYATIAGGHTNDADGQYAMIPGGYGNDADGDYSFAAGRRAQALHDGTFVWADSTDADFASTGPDQFLVRATGGLTLTADSGALRLEPNPTSPNLIGGHVSNTVGADAYGATIGGGGDSSEPNRVTDDYGTVSGGRSNRAGNAATVGGGEANWATHDYATIGGGAANAATALYATVGGGEHNQATGDYAAVGGGLYNDASGNYGTVPGGYYNDAAGEYSFAAGQWARALHDGAFVWADATGCCFDSTADNQFLARATGGVTMTFDTGSLRLLPHATSPNIVAGYSGNDVTTGVYGAAIGGGGNDGDANHVTDAYGTIGGGINNQAGDNTGTPVDARYSTVGGGQSNTASGLGATVSGGRANTVTDDYGTVSGGYLNDVSHLATVGGGYSNEATSTGATVSGGYFNTANDDYASVGGGYNNVITGTASYATIPGGQSNYASGDYAFAAGRRAKANHDGTFVWADSTNADFASTGQDQFLVRATGGVTLTSNTGNLRLLPHATSPNLIGGYSGNSVGAGVYGAAIGGGGNSSSPNSITANYGTVGGGLRNEAGGTYSTVAGGYSNDASGIYSAVGGGYSNEAGNNYATIAGGYNNTASGSYATVAGGRVNTAQEDYSFAAGRQARAQHQGAFVWADSTADYFDSQRDDQLRVRAHGGVRFDVDVTSGQEEWVEIYDDDSDLITTSTGAHLTIGGAWTDSSDRNLKENFTPVDGQEVLARVTELPVTTWNYKAEDASVRHMGPVAQDFYAAFGLGRDDRHIAALDSSGVALAAIQGLYERTQTLEAENATLREQVAALQEENATQQAQIDDVEERLAKLEGGVGADPAQPLESNLVPGAGLLLMGLVLAVTLSKRSVWLGWRGDGTKSFEGGKQR
ncbi:MAG: tail fiber domain-containing protein [Anaerolineae bacterium]